MPTIRISDEDFALLTAHGDPAEVFSNALRSLGPGDPNAPPPNAPPNAPQAPPPNAAPAPPNARPGLPPPPGAKPRLPPTAPPPNALANPRGLSAEESLAQRATIAAQLEGDRRRRAAKAESGDHPAEIERLEGAEEGDDKDEGFKKKGGRLSPLKRWAALDPKAKADAEARERSNAHVSSPIRQRRG